MVSIFKNMLHHDVMIHQYRKIKDINIKRQTQQSVCLYDLLIKFWRFLFSLFGNLRYPQR